jgi:eukaryotic-like serine/threonine-protein kinase
VAAAERLIAGRYRLVRRVGSGGMGVVWEAWDQRLRRPVAIKELHLKPGLTDAEAAVAKQRAMREARLTARLQHRHAVTVFDVVENDGMPCLIMQYSPSRPLSDVLRQHQTLPAGEVARIGAEVASALAAAHEVGIVHRDVKPSNVLLAEDGTAQISDFGIAHALGDATLTTTGMVTGTPAYLAPEVARGEKSGFPADVFSLGATLYTALEGAPPFGTDTNPMALLHRVASGRVVPPIRSGPLEPLLRAMLDRDPAKRPTMPQVREALAEVAVDDVAAAPETTRIEEPRAAAAVAAPATRQLEQASGTTPPPVIAAPERQVAAPPPTRPAAATTVTKPAPPPPPAADPRRRRRAVLAVLALVAAAVIGLAVLLLPDREGATQNSPSAAAPTTATTPADPATATPSETVTGTVSPSSPSPASTPASVPTTAPPATNAGTNAGTNAATNAPTTRAQLPTPGAVAPPAGSVAGTPTSAQLADAVSSYYALMPGNLDAGWARLTASYQVNTAKGRGGYSGFWNTVSRVTATNVTGSAPSTAEATITYYMKDGRVIQERTRYGLVVEGGVLKINTSTVLSSAGG